MTRRVGRIKQLPEVKPDKFIKQIQVYSKTVGRGAKKIDRALTRR